MTSRRGWDARADHGTARGGPNARTCAAAAAPGRQAERERAVLCGSQDDREVLDDGGLLLVRLPKGVLGEDTTRVLGSLVVARVWHAATARAAQPEDTRRDASLYIDECHNFLNLPGSVADMLAEARGYRLGIVLAHQNLAQLPKDLKELWVEAQVEA